MTKRILAISDPHCGHKFGLCPPRWQRQCGKQATFASKMWSEFKQMLQKHGPFDRVFLLGDLIDGRGEKSGGTELITSDRDEQCDIFEDAFKTISLHCNPGMMSMAVFGTGYHVSSNGEDFERNIAKHIGCKTIGGHEWAKVEGVTFDLKHHCGRSSIPWSQYHAQAREAAWNELWHTDNMQPLASVYLRGHTHYFRYGGDGRKLFMTLPCLTWGSKFGSRRCAERIDWGITWFDVADGKLEGWGHDIANTDIQRGRVTVL